MTQEDQERFDLIVNRFEKMDHRFQALQPEDAAFLINQVARLSKDTVKFVGTVVKINPKSNSNGRRLEVTFSGIYNTDLLKEIGLAFDEQVTVYVDREMGQLQMFDEEDIEISEQQMDIFEDPDGEDQANSGPRIVKAIEGPDEADIEIDSDEDDLGDENQTITI